MRTDSRDDRGLQDWSEIFDRAHCAAYLAEELSLLSGARHVGGRKVGKPLETRSDCRHGAGEGGLSKQEQRRGLSSVQRRPGYQGAVGGGREGGEKVTERYELRRAVYVPACVAIDWGKNTHLGSNVSFR